MHDSAARRLAAPLAIPGFQLVERLLRNGRFELYRGRLEESPVLLQAPAEFAADAAGNELLQRAFDLIADVSLPGMAQPREILRHGSTCFLVLEDAGGVPLSSLAPAIHDLGLFFKIAIQLCTFLDELHRRNVVHNCLNPSAVLLDPVTCVVQFADLALASRSAAESQSPAPLPFFDGILPYISPEQTGRMNRAIDYRTDLYSLGITLYELLTGAPPFISEDPLELIHAHIAKTAPSPSSSIADLPPPVSDIVTRLLAKNAEDRYQSALGVSRDLERCSREWSAGVAKPFRLGEWDTSDRFLISQRLYGRKDEVSRLLAAFDRICEGGSTGLVLVTGYSGVGKTSLIQELYKPIVREKGYFISGKFDPVVRNVPFGALIQAFRGLVQQFLTESEESLDAWRARLSEALGVNGGVLTEVVPEIGWIMGAQPAPAPLGPTEAQNRFRLVLHNLLAALGDKQHPLVVFLDDLQWGDPATLSLLQPLLTSPKLRHILFIAACRDNELDAAHPLVRTLLDIQDSAWVSRISLGPLNEKDLNLLLQDTLRADATIVEPLARLVLQKTGGNPFFVRQFLRTLRQEGLLQFEYVSRRWCFSVDEIERASMTDNVIDFLTRKIRQLSARSQTTLTLASCIGNPFDLRTLATISRKSVQQVFDDLGEALGEQLVAVARPNAVGGGEHLPSFSSYAFTHDRIRQAVYALIPDEKKQLIHLTAGRLLLERSAGPIVDERIFDIVHHLNRGGDLITDADERLRLARLNLEAGRKAKSSTAFDAALEHLEKGLTLVTAESWDTDYDLRFALEIEAAECQYLCGHFDEATFRFNLILDHARSRLDRAEVHSLKMLQYENMSRYRESIASGREALALFGVLLPESSEEMLQLVETEVQTIGLLLGSRPIESLVDLPAMEDPEMRMVMKILTALWAPAYITGDQVLTRQISALMVRLSLEHGNVEESAYGYVTHAIMVGPVRGDYEKAYEFGRLALSVNERLKGAKRRAKVHQQFNAHVNLWRRPLQTSIPHAREACRSGLETGDLTYATYGAFTESWAAFLTCRDLNRFAREYEPNLRLIRQLRMADFADAQMVILNWARALQGLTASGVLLSSDEFHEDDYVDSHASKAFFMSFFHVAKLQLGYCFEDYRQALEMEQGARREIGALNGTIWPVLLDFWGSLAETAVYPEAGEGISHLLQRRETFALLSRNCPENFRCPHLLLAAEIERIQGAHAAAVDLFEEAVAYARTTENLQYEALGHELLAKHWLRRNHGRIGAIFMAEAVRLYERWGATAKARFLEQKYGRAYDVTAADERPRAAPAATAIVAGNATTDLDMSTALKAAHAIAEELEMNDLLEKLMSITIESAGAERGFFLQERNGQLFIEAEGTVNRGVRVRRSKPLSEATELSYGVVRYVRNTGEQVIIGDSLADERFAGDVYIRQARPKSILCFPLVHQGKHGGILYLENNLSTNAFTSDRIEIMRILSSQAAISLDKAKLYDEMKQEVFRRHRAETLYRTLLEINNAIITNRTAATLFHATCKALRPVVPFDRAALILHEPETDILRVSALEGEFQSEHFRVGTKIDRTDSHAGWVFDHKKTLLRRDLSAERQFTPERRLAAEGIRSLCTAPLMARGKCMGTLSVLSEKVNQYSDDEASFLREVANQVALAVENMKAYEEISALKGRLEAENVYLQEEIRHEHNFEEIVGDSPPLVALLRQIEKVSPTDSTVLICGETGTGKELIARAIHNRSARRDRPLVKVNCAAISAGLVESELFGHVKGAFTGAIEPRSGRFEVADGGSLFLDEVGELPPETQTKLLRVLQEQEFEPVGSNRTIRVDVRILAATNRDLSEAVADGRFRADLYYRLNVFPLTVPPLRERPGDIPQLVNLFVSRFSKEMGRVIAGVTSESMSFLVGYSWPGNIRELQNVLQRAVVLSSGPLLSLGRDLVPSQSTPGGYPSAVPGGPAPEHQQVRPDSSLADAERRHIVAVLEKTNGVIEGSKGAAKQLGLHPNTLRSRMKKLGIRRADHTAT